MSFLRKLKRRAHEVDLRLFTRVARLDSETLDRTLPRITRAADNSRLWMALAALMFVSGRKDLRRAATRGLLSIAATSGIVNGPMKWLGRRTRPRLDLVPEARRVLRVPVTTSFPSGHTSSAFAFATGAAVESRVAGALLYPLASAVGFSRIYTGAHYPGDVLVGAAIGSGAAALTGRMWPIPPEGGASVQPVKVPDRELPSSSGQGLTIVINQASGGRGFDVSKQLASLLPDAELIEVDPQEGEALGPALERAAEGKAIGVCGGDGTVNAAAKIAVERDKPLLVIPGGTLDHFAHALDIDSPKAAARALAEENVAAVDIAWIDDRPFLNTASLGSYVELVEAREKLEKRIGKWPALMVATWQVLRRIDPVTVELDGTKKNVWLVFFGNCHYRPSGFGPSWRERLDDGIIDLRYVEADSPWARTRFFAAVFTGRLGRCKVYAQQPVRSLKVSLSDDGTRLSRDGEVFSGSSTFEVSKSDKGLKVFVPSA